MTLQALYTTLLERRGSSEHSSYTASLFAGGIDKLAKKIGEETAELIVESCRFDGQRDDPEAKQALIHESADIMFHYLALLAYLDIPLADIELELESRSGVSGLTEKANRIQK